MVTCAGASDDCNTFDLWGYQVPSPGRSVNPFDPSERVVIPDFNAADLPQLVHKFKDLADLLSSAARLRAIVMS